MSTAMTLTIASPPPSPPSTSASHSTSPCCPNCGFSLPAALLLSNPGHSSGSGSSTSPPTAVTVATTATSTTDDEPAAQPTTTPSTAELELAKARHHIADLETQIKELNEKATAAIYRWADYENELSRLRGSLSLQSPTTLTAPSTNPSPLPSPPPPPRPRKATIPNPQPATSPIRSSFLPSPRRISSLLAPRKSTPNLRVAGLDASSASLEDLTAALAREHSLREEAEARLRRTSAEVEELSAALFEQANEMVAGERRARAKLEERVEVLEAREGAKRRRLEVLEEAVGRMQRAREVLEEQREKEKEREVEIERRRSEGVRESAEGPIKVDFSAAANTSTKRVDGERGSDLTGAHGSPPVTELAEKRVSATTDLSRATTVTITEVEVTQYAA